MGFPYYSRVTQTIVCLSIASNAIPFDLDGTIVDDSPLQVGMAIPLPCSISLSSPHQKAEERNVASPCYFLRFSLQHPGKEASL